MVLPGHPLPDRALHQSRQTRQHIDRRINLLVVHLPINKDLPLRDVPRQVGNRVRDVIIRHRQNRQLSDRAVLALHTTRPFINGRQVCIEVAGVAAPAGDFFSRGGNLSQ